MTRTVEADYLVVGAGATGMAFTDALVDHSDATVALVDRRHGVGGHWLEAYPFVRLHQSSAFYGVASTLLGGGQLQQSGPERGLQERASQAEICLYYARVLERLQATGRVELFANSEYAGDRTVVSHVTGETFRVPDHCRVVDAHHLAPTIPAEVPPPFAVEAGARVVPVNALARLQEAPSRYVVVGSGKTATDAIVWLLGRGVDPGAITWVRPREPWMLNRAVIQPDPAIFIGMAADTMQSAADAASLDDFFLRLEDAGIMLRIDRGLVPTMAKAPTLGVWELELLRTVEHVLRHGHLASVAPGRLTFTDGTTCDVPADTLVVHCAADGLRQPPQVPIWTPDAITLQPVRNGFPTFGAALIGYAEATRDSDDARNAVVRPSSYGNSLAEWAGMTLRGSLNARTYSAEPDIKQWIDGVALNPARVPPGHPGSPALDDAIERLAQHAPAGLARLEQLQA